MAKPLTISKAWACAAMNQLAFPGAGTVMAGRKIGYLQSIIMVSGFLLTMYFFCWYIGSLVQAPFQNDWNETVFYSEVARRKWIAIIGGIICAAAWLWALVSSLSIVKEARGHPPILQSR
jgi:uncharacterized membrane protein (DUF485 family)